MIAVMTSQIRKQAGFGKPAVILFLLLILSLLAAAYCFVEANVQTAKHHKMQSVVSKFRLTSSQIMIDSVVPGPVSLVSPELASGEKLLDTLRSGDPAKAIPAIPKLLEPEVSAIQGAWLNFVQGLEMSGRALRADTPAILSAEQLDTLSGLNTSLGNWLQEIEIRKEHAESQKQIGHLLSELISVAEQSGKKPSDEAKRKTLEVWRVLKSQMPVLSIIDNVDARILVDEMQAEVKRLNALIDPVVSKSELAKTSFANQYAKNSELQLLLGKLQEGIDVLEHEQNYLFRLGVVAALFSLLFLFILAIVFWRDSENKVARSNQKNATNQRAILRLLDEITDLAEGDLTTRATVTEDITGAIADSVNYAVDTIRGLVITMNHVSARVSAAAEHTGDTAKRLTRASNLQERETRRSSNYITAMAKTMKQMSDRANDARDVANQSVLQAQSGYAAVSETMEGMDEIRQQIQDTSKRLKRLGESSQQIGEIISLVNDIAERTNLLSLNAAIQASANGGHNNFSAVSDEVQRLAERVNEATRDIEGLIVTIQADTRAAISSMELSTSRVVKGSSLAEQAGEALNEIQLVSRDLSEKIQDIADKSIRQAEVTSKLSGNMQVISHISIQTNEGLKGTAGSIDQLHSMAKNLTRSVEKFVLPTDIVDDEFLESELLAGIDRVDMDLKPDVPVDGKLRDRDR